MTEAAAETDDADDAPDIDDDEIADLDLGVDPDDVEEEAGRSADDDGDESDDVAPEMGDEPAGQTWGDMYVSGLTTTVNAVRKEYGSGEELDEQLARDIDLDYYFDEFMRSRGRREEMPPEQALLVGTTLFLVVGVAGDSELAGNVMEEI